MIVISEDLKNGGFNANLPPALFQHLPDNIFTIIIEKVVEQFMQKHGAEIVDSIPLDAVRRIVAERAGEQIGKSLSEKVTKAIQIGA